MESVRDPVSVTPDNLSRKYTSFQPCAPEPVYLGRDSYPENSVRDAFASQLFAGHFQNESFKLCARQVLAYAFQPAHEILAHTILSRVESLVTDSKRAEDRLTAGSYRLLWK